jgi:hypothetical protein
LESEQVQQKGAARPGLTLEELISIASEAGIDPENIRIAAGELDKEDPGEKGKSKKKVSDQVYTERWVDRRLSDETADSVIAELKHRYDASETEREWMEEWPRLSNTN